MKHTILKKWVVTLIITLLYLNMEVQGMNDEEKANTIPRSKKKSKCCWCLRKNTHDKITLKKTDFWNECVTGMDFFDDLEQREKDNVVQLLSQGQDKHGVNEDVLIDMETKFKMIPAQTKQLYEFLAPQAIQIKGVTGANKEINGFYFRGDIEAGRIFYFTETGFKSIFWQDNVWYIGNTTENPHNTQPDSDSESVLGKKTFANAYLAEDVLFPTLSTKHWLMYDKVNKEFNENENLVLEKIVSKNKEEEDALLNALVAPQQLKMSGFTAINSQSNGIYEKFLYQGHNGHVAYQSKTHSRHHIYWKHDVWCIGDMLDKHTCHAYLEEDVLFPTLATKHWNVFDRVNKKWNEDHNIIMEDDSKNIQQDNYCNIV